MDVGGTLDQLEATLMGIKLQSMIPACGFSYMKARYANIGVQVPDMDIGGTIIKRGRL
jgi:hypothetical protein